MAWTMGCYQDLKIFYNYDIFKSFYVESIIYKVVVGIQTLANTILISEHLCSTVCTPVLTILVTSLHQVNALRKIFANIRLEIHAPKKVP